MQTRPVPAEWKNALKQETVEILPLIDDPAKKSGPGWTTYPFEIDESPEAEIICGGVNEKIPECAAVWRQGNLLHFGFEEGPDRLNTAGRALLLNAITYIARFTEDRPIAATPSVFVTQKSIPIRRRVRDWMKAKNADEMIDHYFETKAAMALHALPEGEERAHEFDVCRGRYGIDAEMKLRLDPRLFLIDAPANNEPSFFDHALSALASDDAVRRTAAHEALAAYVPDGPVTVSDPAAWKAWIGARRDYLFFSDSGGYRWYIDPLAMKRGIPSAKLRGPARADRR